MAAPQCSKYEDDTAFLLQVRYSYNIWHTWNEGLMGIFQTLREIGKLPLAAVGPKGELSEVTSGMGGAECPWVFDYRSNRAVRGKKCSKRQKMIPAKQKCNMQTESWCREGAVFSFNRNSSNAPLILKFTPESTMNVWSHLYDSMTSKQKDFNTTEGTCFKDLIVGKTSTLNFYQTLNATQPDPAVLARVPRINNVDARVEAMAVFKAFTTSSQREWASLQARQEGSTLREAHQAKQLEKLRRGVGPEDINSGILAAIDIKSAAGPLREEAEEIKKLEKQREEQMKPVLDYFQELYGIFKSKTDLMASDIDKLCDEEALAARISQIGMNQNDDGINMAAGLGHEVRRHLLFFGSKLSERQWFEKNAEFRHESPRPVVTYMSRNFFSRGVMNERSILEYILLHYNVTLKVTTFQEPLLEVMDLLGHSDVMFGMHGAGWTNALFMKRGATAMQIYPYGWKLPNNSTVRGYNYREIVYANEGKYMEWVNPVRENAFFRRIDFKKGKESHFKVHPDPQDPLPKDSWPGNQWVYQNTYIDMSIFGPQVDGMMERAGIERLP